MTRDEAAEVLAKIADFAEVIPGGLEIHRSEKCVAIDALRVALAALRGPVPDPDTGLVRCGCGGKVDVAFYPGWHGVPDMYQVDCFNCHVGTRPCQTAEQAKAAWNAAMGWKGGAE